MAWVSLVASSVSVTATQSREASNYLQIQTLSALYVRQNIEKFKELMKFKIVAWRQDIVTIMKCLILGDTPRKAECVFSKEGYTGCNNKAVEMM